jgi:hypothetical protein
MTSFNDYDAQDRYTDDGYDYLSNSEALSILRPVAELHTLAVTTIVAVSKWHARERRTCREIAPVMTFVSYAYGEEITS